MVTLLGAGMERLQHNQTHQRSAQGDNHGTRHHQTVTFIVTPSFENIRLHCEHKRVGWVFKQPYSTPGFFLQNKN
jgi:hypothetical protein